MNFLSQWWQLNGFFSSVNPFMRSQVDLLNELLVTVVAVEWFLSNVNPFMHSQVVLLVELLVTVVAVEWYLSSLNFTETKTTCCFLTLSTLLF